MKTRTKRLVQIFFASILFGFLVARMSHDAASGAPSPTANAVLQPTPAPFYIYALLGLGFVLFSALGLGLMRKKSFLS